MRLSIGDVELGLIPRVVGAVSDKDISNLSSEAVERVDILELRVDMFRECSAEYAAGQVKAAKARFGKPVISTVRARAEGGYADVSDDARETFFEILAPISDALDVEIASVRLLEKVASLCREHGGKLIGSYHNFKETPSIGTMNEILLKGKNAGADIVKIAAHARTKDDVALLADFTVKNKDKGLAAISLGNIGLMSRIFNPVMGSLLTYGHLGSPSAPGQISAIDIVEHLRMFDPQYNEALIDRLRLLEYV